MKKGNHNEVTVLGSLISERSIRNKSGTDYPVYSVTNSEGFCRGYFSKEVASEDKQNYKVVEYGDFAYNPSRINVGSIDWYRNSERGIISPLYVTFSVNEKLNKNYLKYYLKSDLSKQYIKTFVTGSVRDNLKFSILAKMPITLPSIEEQKRRSSTLLHIDKQINRFEMMSNLFDDIVKSRFIEMFGDVEDNPMNWPTDTLKKHIDLLAGYPIKSTDYTEQGIKICGGLIIMPDRIDWANCKHLSYADGYERYLLKEEDIVIALDRPWINDGFKIGKIHKSDLPALLIQRTARVRGLDLNQNYLYSVLRSQAFKNHCKVTGSLVPHISSNDIMNFNVPIPPIDIQLKYAQFINIIDKSKFAIQESVNELEKLKKSLMQEYFG